MNRPNTALLDQTGGGVLQMLVKEAIFECPKCNEKITTIFSEPGWRVKCTKCYVTAEKVGSRVINTKGGF